MSNRKEILAITPYGNDGKSSWTKIGAAFTNKDGSLTLRFDVGLPTFLSRERDDGGSSVMIRDPLPREDKGSSGNSF